MHSQTGKDGVLRYTAAGGVVVDGDRVLVLLRPSRDEVRLPKGHVDPGETPREAALREVAEESGYANAIVKAELGTQQVGFERKDRQVMRTEHYFLLFLADTSPPDAPEKQFVPAWMTWDEALESLTYPAEREWVRRAKAADSQ